MFFTLRQSDAFTALFAIDLGLHLIDQVWLLVLHLNGEIPALCLGRVSTGSTINPTTKAGTMPQTVELPRAKHKCFE